MVDNAERKILDMVEGGKISAEEGLRLMNAMKGAKETHSPVNEGDDHLETAPQMSGSPASGHPMIPEAELARMNRLKRWWVLPFGVGLLVTSMGAVWMYLGYADNGFGWGFWLAWLPFLLGIFLMVLSYQTSRSVWVHVRIRQKPGEKPERISISLPMPLRLAKWFLGTFGNHIPGLKDQPVGDFSEILETLTPEEPFYVHVNDEDDGEEVEVFIG